MAISREGDGLPGQGSHTISWLPGDSLRGSLLHPLAAGILKQGVFVQASPGSRIRLLPGHSHISTRATSITFVGQCITPAPRVVITSLH